MGGLAAQQADDVAPTSSLVAVQTTGGASSRALGGLVAGPYDVETGPFDNRCLGVDHAWGHYWVSGGGHTTVGWSFMVHKYTTTGTYVASYPQTTFATTWGARDLESDEANNKLWGGAEGGELSTYNYDSTSGGLVHATLQTTAVPTTVRALARNPASGNFYTANFTSSVYEFNPAGTVVNSWASPGSALYGFAWDCANSTLWGHGQDAAFASRHVFKLNLATMTNTGTEYAAPNTGIAGGLDMYLDSRNPGFLSHVTLGQGTPDNVVVSDSGVGGAGCAKQQGKVVLGEKDRFPMKDVEVKAFKGGVEAGKTTTGADGKYTLNLPAGKGYRFAASIQYQIPATNDTVTIKNYPDWKPGQEFEVKEGGALPEIVYPAPVLMQSGFNAGLTTWPSMRGYLAKDPETDDFKKKNAVPAFLCFPMPNKKEDAKGYDNGGKKVEDHDDNAKLLIGWKDDKVEPVLKTWLKAEDADKCQYSVVAHSMGGLIARAMVTSKDSPPILRIASLDAIHGGTTFGGWARPDGTSEAALNGKTKNEKTGTAEPDFATKGWNEGHKDLDRPKIWLLYSCVPDKVVEPDRSARGFGRTMKEKKTKEPSGWELEWVKGARVDVGEGHGGLHSKLERQQEVALFLAWSKTPEENDSLRRGGRAATATWGLANGGIIAAPGGAATAVIAFDGNAMIAGSVLLTGAPAGYVFLDPAGLPLSLSNFESQQIGDGAYLESFELFSPPTGMITLRLDAGALDQANLDYALFFDNEREAVAELAPQVVSSGSPVQIVAWLEDAAQALLIGSNGTAEATVVLPDSSEQIVPLFDDGQHGDGLTNDGVYGESFFDTFLEGRYHLNLQLRTDLAAETVQRSVNSGFAVAPSSAMFAGVMTEFAPDANGDLLYDALVFRQDVSFTRNGNFKLQGTLEDGFGASVTHLQVDYQNSIGPSNATLELTVPGGVLVRHGVDGPWILKEITLYDLDAGTLPAASGPDYTTQSYAIASFEPPPPPSVASILPQQGSGFGGEEVLVTGDNLDLVELVHVGGRPAVFVSAGAETLLLTIPPPSAGPPFYAGNREPITVDFLLQTPWGSVTVPAAYTYGAQLQRR